MSPRYIAREWTGHAATSVGYVVDDQFHQVAECSGFGRSSEEGEAMAAQIVDALNGVAALRSSRDALAESLRDVIDWNGSRNPSGDDTLLPPEKQPDEHIANAMRVLAQHGSAK